MLVGTCFIHSMLWRRWWSRCCVYLWSSNPSGRLPVCVPYLWKSFVPNCQSSCPSLHHLWSLWRQTHGYIYRVRWIHESKTELLYYCRLYMSVDCYLMYHYIVLVCSCFIGVFSLFLITFHHYNLKTWLL